MRITDLSTCLYIITSIGLIFHLPFLVYASGLFAVWLIYQLIRRRRKTRWWEYVYAIVMLLFWGVRVF